MNKISKYFRGVAEEARRIRWPDQKTLWKAVGVVLSISLIAALFIVLSDWLTLYINRGLSNAFNQGSEASSSTVAMRYIGDLFKF